MKKVKEKRIACIVVKDLSRKVKSVKRIHQERGRYSGGDVPYGYQKGGADTRSLQESNDRAELYAPKSEK